MAKYKLSSLLGMSLISVAVFAGINEDLSNFYNSLGYDGNITSAGAYQGQEAGYYSGGSMALRSRVRTLQVIHLDAPSIRAGCGGIDIFLGGFSFVSGEQITKFFRHVMNNAMGYAFNLALETMVPEIAHAMQYIQKMAQEVNALNESSCEMAEALVGGMWPKTRANHQQVCRDLGTNSSHFADWAKARQGCNSATEQREQLDKAAEDPKYKKMMLINKNIVWTAIKESKFLGDDDEVATLLMNLTGTLIYDAESKPTAVPQQLNEKIVKALLDGGSADVSKCSDKECLNTKEGNITIAKEKGLRNQIIKLINDIVVGTRNDTPVSPKEIGFISSIGMPITKFTNVSLATGNESQALNLTNYADAIAKDVLKKYLVELLELTRQSIKVTGDYDPKTHKKFDQDISRALAFVENLKVDSHRDIQDLEVLKGSMRGTEREVTSKVSEQLKKHLGS
jgi:conjugative transfer pilus assembly protein TraH